MDTNDLTIARWVPIEEIAITPEVNSIHVDTRDFCCLLTKDTRKSAIKGPKFLIPVSQIKDWLLELERMTGGKGDWRCMNFQGIDANGWFKYIRLYRNDDESFIVCDREGHSVDIRLMTEDRLNKKGLCFQQ